MVDWVGLKGVDWTVVALQFPLTVSGKCLCCVCLFDFLGIGYRKMGLQALVGLGSFESCSLKQCWLITSP